MKNSLLSFITLCTMLPLCSAVAQRASVMPGAHYTATPSGNILSTSNTVEQHCQRAKAALNRQQAHLLSKLNAAKTTAATTTERLIGTSTYNYNSANISTLHPFGITDSMKLTYSGERGSAFDLYTLSFDVPSVDEFDPGTYPSANYPNGDPNHNVTETLVLPDSIFYWRVSSDSLSVYAYRFSEKITNTYDANSNIISYLDISYPFDSSIYSSFAGYTNTYAAGTHNITSSYDLSWNTTTPRWDTLCLTTYSYNSSGDITKDSYAGNVDNYYYNSSGYLDSMVSGYDSSGIFVQNFRMYVFYNTDNTLATDSQSTFIYGRWTPCEKDSFGYTPGISYWTYLSNYYWNLNIVQFWQKFIQTKHVNTSGLPDTLYFNYYNENFKAPSFIDFGNKTAYTYDTYGNPTEAWQYTFVVTDSASGAGFYDTTGTMNTHYYYQNYTVNAVHQVPAIYGGITLYPNPTGDVLYITATGNITSVALTNLLGQVIYNRNYNSPQAVIDVSALPPGMYFATVNNQEVRKFVKQ